MRKFTEESKVTMCFTNRDCPLIRIRSKKDVEYFINKTEKMRAITERKKSDRFIIAWAGQYKTDVFEVTDKDITDIILNY